MRTIRDLPLEKCLDVRGSLPLGQVAADAEREGLRYVVVREAEGGVKGVQLTAVASWLAAQSPASCVDALPVVNGVSVEPSTTVMEALSMLATTRAAVLLVKDVAAGSCRVVQRNLVELSASADAGRHGVARTGWLS